MDIYTPIIGLLLNVIYMPVNYQHSTVINTYPYYPHAGVVMTQFGASSDLRYAAIEKVYDRIRLAYDGCGSVYIMDNSEEPFSAPFDMAAQFGELYNCHMDTYRLNGIEINWVRKMRGFASELSRTEPEPV